MLTSKTSNTLHLKLLQPLPITNHIWEDLAMDFITRLPSSHSYKLIIVVIDKSSKHAHFTTLRYDYTSK